jgi:Fe-S-cluster-containing dehydrogenase component/formate-dependent nitrite reductase membrane component NrfD
MRYAFAIDHNRCIGCHACTVACKEEHNVPIGVNRTWVKYIEKGRFPDAKRHFAVLRCNHCDDAPCVSICPTVALYRREDGIVDFDSDRCIGCKSCMQACPYDALYINPDTNTAAKCNFCAHRVENNIQPACEVVCPVQAITSGDLDDPSSRISQIVTTRSTAVRKPEKNTRPQVHYVGVEQDLLKPERIKRTDTYMWADKPAGEDPYAPPDADDAEAREVYDVPHPTPWGWKIGAYLWTKSIAAGVLLIAALFHFLGGANAALTNVLSPIVALVFITITTFLLVIDLKRPERFLYLLFKPNPRSWLVLGGYILIAYGGVATLWLGLWILNRSVPGIVVVAAALLALGAACYSAFLFAQAKGRDLWQSPSFFWHLALQAIAAGAATTIICGLALGLTADALAPVGKALMTALVVALAITLVDTLRTPGTAEAKRAHKVMSHGALRGQFWGLAVGLGMLLPTVVLAASIFVSGPSVFVLASASVFSLIGLWFYEDVWVKAGQALPLS